MTESIREAQLKKTEAGLIPQGEGWFVLNARDVSWIQSEERGQDTDFQGWAGVDRARLPHPGSVAGSAWPVPRRARPGGLPGRCRRVRARDRRTGAPPEGLGLRPLPAVDEARVRRGG